jgi:hypothetical protein
MVRDRREWRKFVLEAKVHRGLQRLGRKRRRSALLWIISIEIEDMVGAWRDTESQSLACGMNREPPDYQSELLTTLPQHIKKFFPPILQFPHWVLQQSNQIMFWISLETHCKTVTVSKWREKRSPFFPSRCKGSVWLPLVVTIQVSLSALNGSYCVMRKHVTSTKGLKICRLSFAFFIVLLYT